MSGSPIDSMPTPETLEARVVRPGDAKGEPLLHGYGVQTDLAPHYAPSEQVLLSLLGELPEPVQVRRFQVASAFASAVSARDASVHAAILARRYGSATPALVSVAAIVLAERARDEVEAFLELRGDPGGEPPAALVGVDDGFVARLRDALSRVEAELPVLARAAWRPTAALCLTLEAVGLSEAWQLETALTLARLPVVMAEAMAHEPGDLHGYPIRQPPFELHDD